jgi:uncharacterized short protein YbdD (DUF466 family)
MICRCFGKTLDVGAWGQRTRAALELMVGLPDYDVYVAHMAANHPEQGVVSRDAFFRARQEAKFGGGGGLRCC